MRAAVIGIGKTGEKVIENLNEDELFGAYNSKNVPSASELSLADVIIVFVPNNNLIQLIDKLLDSGRPVIWAVTGFTIPSDLIERINIQKVPWVYSANFSLGMNIVREMLKIIRGGFGLLSETKIEINEIHHTKKIDAPSGTAILWDDLLGSNASISSERVGDVVGTHQLTISTPSEEIFLEHKANDRSLFAMGAIWAARKVVEEKNHFSGFVSFEDFTKEIIRKYL